VNKIWSL